MLMSMARLFQKAWWKHLRTRWAETLSQQVPRSVSWKRGFSSTSCASCSLVILSEKRTPAACVLTFARAEAMIAKPSLLFAAAMVAEPLPLSIACNLVLARAARLAAPTAIEPLPPAESGPGGAASPEQMSDGGGFSLSKFRSTSSPAICRIFWRRRKIWVRNSVLSCESSGSSGGSCSLAW
jgi:hypothetical protein